MAEMIVVDRDGTEHRVAGKVGASVMETLRELDYGVAAVCGGMCSCATCHVFIEPEWFKKLPKVQSDELELLESTENFRAGESRLACQVRVSDAIEGITLTVAPEE